jgi:hypothetical protein
MVNLLIVFLHLLAFPNTVEVEFCFCEDVRLIRHVITNHVPVRIYRHCDCLPIGIVNCVKVFRIWKKKFDILKEELHIYVKAIPTQKIREIFAYNVFSI